MQEILFIGKRIVTKRHEFRRQRNSGEYGKGDNLARMCVNDMDVLFY